MWFMALYLNVHVQAVVEIAEPEQMRESQRDVEGVQLFIAQRQLTQDIQIVLVASARGQRSLVKNKTMNCVFAGQCFETHLWIFSLPDVR